MEMVKDSLLAMFQISKSKVKPGNVITRGAKSIKFQISKSKVKRKEWKLKRILKGDVSNL